MSKFIWTALATCGGLGKIPWAPGTWGSLGGLLVWWALFEHLPFAYVIGLMLLTPFVSWKVIEEYSRTAKSHDASEIVIDEWVGVGVALAASDFSGLQVLAAFVLFRVFDISKPPGVRFFDRRPDSLGVLMDDVVAGLYAAVLLGVYNVSFG